MTRQSSHALVVYERSAKLMRMLGNEARQAHYEWAMLMEAEGLKLGCISARAAPPNSAKLPSPRHAPWA